MLAEEIERLLDADESSNPDNSLALHLMIQEARRKRAHAKEKSKQPILQTGISEDDLSAVICELRKPITDKEREHCLEGMDQQLLMLIECCTSNHADLLFHLIRIARKHWAACPHIGPIEVVPAPVGKGIGTDIGTSTNDTGGTSA